MPADRPPFRRLPDWKPRLAAYVLACADRPFQHGRHDCMLFAAGAVEAVTGVDLAAGWRGRYTTLAGGLRILRRAGYADPWAMADAHFARAPRSMLAPGDLAAMEGEEGLAMGVVQGGGGVYCLRPIGWSIEPLAQARVAWAVR